jgi:hypothetical protein
VSEDAAATGFYIGLALVSVFAIPFAFHRAIPSGVIVTIALLLVPNVFAHGDVILPASAEDHTVPTVRTESGATWLVHPMGIAVRVGPRATLDENETTLRATRYPTLGTDATATSWVDPDAALRIDLIVMRVDPSTPRVRDEFCQSVTRGAVTSLDRAGATFIRPTTHETCDVSIASIRPDDATLTSRLVMIETRDGHAFVMMSVVGDTSAAEAVLASLRRE